MAAPTYSAGTPGNVINGIGLASGGTKNSAALVDLSTVLGGALHCQMTTGSTAPTAATTFRCFRAYASTVASPSMTLSAAASSGSTTLSVNSASGINRGQQIAIVTAAGLVGEIATVSSISGATLTLAVGTINAYSTNDLVFLIEQTASGGTVAPGSSWAANTTYSTTIYPPSAWLWIVQAVNADTAQAVTASVTLDKNPAFQ
jgi:hypothetical protein